MHPGEFLNKKLSALSRQFSDVTFRYGYDKKIDSYLIELTPAEKYYDNSALTDAWVSVSIQFMEMYPFEGIAFISSDSILSDFKEEKIFNEKPRFIQNKMNIIYELILNSYTELQFPVNAEEVEKSEFLYNQTPEIKLNLNIGSPTTGFDVIGETLYCSAELINESSFSEAA